MRARWWHKWIIGFVWFPVLFSIVMGIGRAEVFAVPPATVGSLQARLERFPEWRSPVLPSAQGDLYYPDWMAGEWQVVSTLIEAQAPFAPDIVTPGFAASRATLQQPVTFSVRFRVEPQTLAMSSPSLIQTVPTASSSRIVADRAYNACSLTEAVLGKGSLQSVRLDPRSPNRQIAIFKGGQRLITRITARATEIPTSDRFLSSELYQQEFQSDGQLYLNQVENTIAYRRVAQDPPRIEAEQVTAIYLSPQDPDYFKVRNSPTALYRYRLTFEPAAAGRP